MTETAEMRSCFEQVLLLGTERADEVIYTHVAQDGSQRDLTGAWLSRRAQQLAAAYLERGVVVGDRIALGLRNSPEFVIGALACWLTGAVPVPVRWDVPEWELERLKQVIEPRIYLGPDELDWIAATADAPVPELTEQISPHLQGICSSGSTGTPKIILASLPAYLNPVFGRAAASRWMPVPRPQQILVLGPMYHVNAFTGLHNLLAGDRLVVLEKFDAGLALQLIEQRGISTFTATPTMLQRMADHPDADKRDLSSIVWVQQGAAPMPVSLAHRWFDLIGPEKLLMAYGMTEGLGLTMLRGDEYLEHEGSVGRPMPGTEIAILDDAAKPVPTREIGEIYMRSTTHGGSIYLGEVPQLRDGGDGFKSVGDMGYVDEDGYLYVVDRRVDMIITGGANVFPAEVETALIDHPAIADVVVIGLRDEQWGRRVHAIVEPADPSRPPTLDDVRAYAKSRLLPYKVPKTIEIVDAIPRSAATKINRGRLIEVRGG